MKGAEFYEKQDIKKYLTSIGAWYTITFMAGYGKSGVSDIIACIDGIFWGIEVKREGKEPTVIQRERMTEIGQAGGMTVAGTAAVVIERIEQWRKRTGRKQ